MNIVKNLPLDAVLIPSTLARTTVTLNDHMKSEERDVILT